MKSVQIAWNSLYIKVNRMEDTNTCTYTGIYIMVYLFFQSAAKECQGHSEDSEWRYDPDCKKCKNAKKHKDNYTLSRKKHDADVEEAKVNPNFICYTTDMKKIDTIPGKTHNTNAEFHL